MSLATYQKAVDDWISQFEEGYWSPLANLARLTEEVGELARAVNHFHGEKPRKPGEPDTAIAEELGDVIFVAIAMANSLGIDLDEVMAGVLDRYRSRDADRWTRRTDGE